ncbi:MAG: CoA transferase [Deltaproteobacteria bacterium]|nr:CoA transferase [Deltaproteobacteria bacterium]
MDSLLNGFRALDLTDEKGLACGKILAALGIDVIKIEKPGGDSARYIPPFLDNVSDPENSLYWLAFNTDKRGITLNLETPQGQDLFRELVNESDFVLESFQPGTMDQLGLGYENLKQINPGIILVSITSFGQKGPYSRYKGSELIAYAMSGILGIAGEPDRPPVMEPVGSVYFQACAAAACGAVVSHYYREKTGRGQQVDISIAEVTTNRNTGTFSSWEFDKVLRKRGGPVSEFGKRPSKQIWQCKDGYVFWIFWGGPLGAPGNRALCEWMEEDGIQNPFSRVSDWENFNMAKVTREEHNAFEAAITTFFLRHTKEEISTDGLMRGIRAHVISNPADVFQNSHLNARDYWIKLDYSERGIKLAHSRHFFLCNETMNFVRHRAPHVGEHNNEIFSKEMGISPEVIAELKKGNVI